jgi:hypothetical protein
MNKSLFVFACTLLFSAFTSAQNDSNVRIEVSGGARVIPISLSGYNGEAASVLRFDLEVAGFEITDGEKAQYTLTGKNDGGQIEGRLQDRLSKANLLAKAYTGDNMRLQAHALADDVVMAILKIPGIARTKVSFKHEKSQGNSEIYISDYDGQNAKAVTADNSIVAAPAWLPKQWHLFSTHLTAAVFPGSTRTISPPANAVPSRNFPA